MEAIRIQVSSWTASFRYSGFMIGFQPTLPIPPVSTIYGLISAAVGEPTTPHDTFICYTFTNEGKSVDLEKILEVKPGSPGKTNVIKREILSEAKLTLYVSPELKDSFMKPRYPLLLGRSSDLASVDEIHEVELTEVDGNTRSNFGRGLYTNPPVGYHFSTIYSLPVYFSNTIPRKPLGSRRFFVIDERYSGIGKGYIDNELPKNQQVTMELFSPETLNL